MRKRFWSNSSARVRIVVALTLFLYLTFLRTRHISETFWLLGDQILYWRMALGPWDELPLGGGPSSVGGTTLGPAFVWTMWGIRHLVGPWVDYLPHAGGIGLSVIQSLADACLFIAIWKRFASPALAIGVTLLVASAPYDMALTATIWNPPLAVAFIKIAIAFVLLGNQDQSIWWDVAATTAAVLALQSHSSAVFFAAPLAASLVARDLLANRRYRAIQYLLSAGIIVLALETPFLIDRALHPEKGTTPPVIVDNVRYTIGHPEAFRPAAAFREVADANAFILLRPWETEWFAPLLAVCALVTAFRTRHEMPLAAITYAPLVFAGVGFSFWQQAFNHYWFLTIAPSAALTVALAATAWQPVAPLVATCLALLFVLAQPSRLSDSMTMHRLPEYGSLVRGSQEIRRRVAEVRSIETEFELPPSSDRQFVFEILGGRVTPTAPLLATIEKTGRVRFVQAE
jgi:hypothetical protein